MTARSKIKYSKKKFRELLLYVSEQCQGDPKFGDTKLNKLMFFAESECFGRFGKPITGQKFQKLPYGHGSRPLWPVRQEMVKRGEVAVREIESGGYQQRVTVPLREPDLSAFAPNEIAVIDAIIRRWWGRSAVEISDKSHNEVGWQMVDEKDDIPYEAVFFVRRELSPEEIAFAEGLESTEFVGK